MIRWVLDAAALVDLLVVAGPAHSLREAFRYERCAAPAVIDLDAAALLSRLVDASALSEAEALQVLDDVYAAPVQRFDTVPLRAGVGAPKARGAIAPRHTSAWPRSSTCRCSRAPPGSR